MDPTCATCRFFIPDELETEDPNDIPEEDPDNGTCHFAAPTPVMFQFLGADEEADATTIWPAVDAGDWCGSYKMLDGLKKGKKAALPAKQSEG